ncbi:precorrin-2/cobalt-factor-2 C20-methyltransferase [Balneicella halophila]|uniref:Precorrin-2/cobalt-factor-2 C20-methyltransferase n=1 Tax=Balneicella halophila TaxID=1537566 RepID=A0A7L4URV9_BALHA|nr:precorrin-2 C(20)-methyltransferase [Balneicella halophila]PVX52161.1 precorrin-2/cobalt-factor-2 C20-methyltransferase [Balneicella halophila]
MNKAIFFVSLGPGDAELVTIKALRCLENAEAIFCPSTTTKSGKTISRALKIMKTLGIDEGKIHPFDVPMSKERSLTKKDYETTAEKIASYFEKAEKDIVVCAQGDASFYSSVYYISELLTAKNLPIKRIAGVPAFIAAGTLANIHIVKQEERLRVLPGVFTMEELRQECEAKNTVVIMKMSQSEEIIKTAIQDFANTTFHYFENVGVEEKEYYTKSKNEILARKFPYFSLMIIQKSNN